MPSSLVSDEMLDLSWGAFLGLFIVPNYIVLTCAARSVVQVYLHFRKTNKKSDRRRMSRQRSSLVGTIESSPASENWTRAPSLRTTPSIGQLQKDIFSAMANV